MNRGQKRVQIRSIENFSSGSKQKFTFRNDEIIIIIHWLPVLPGSDRNNGGMAKLQQFSIYCALHGQKQNFQMTFIKMQRLVLHEQYRCTMRQTDHYQEWVLLYYARKNMEN